jgi:hypothetical protein
MNKYLVFLKNPKIWVGIILFIGIIVSIILIIKALKPTPLPETKLCRGDKTKTTCPDGSIQCADKCIPAQKWDCKTQSCICPTGTSLCDKKSACCSVCNPDDTCCYPGMESKDTHGNPMCCPPGTEPDPSGKRVGCNSVCGVGVDQKGCDTDQLCNEIKGLSPNELSKMKTDAGDNYRGDDGNVIYLCSNPSSDCSWGTDTYLPYHTGSGAVTYYNADSIFKGKEKDDVDNICIPNDINSYTDSTNTCFNLEKAQCVGNTSCEWKSSLDILSDAQNGHSNLYNIMTSINDKNGNSPDGYYCGDGGQSWLQYFRKDASGTCGYQDCNNALIQPGVIKINWDETNGVCTSLKSTDNNIGIVGGVQCTEVGKPCTSCTADNLGSFVDCVKCHGTGSTAGPCKECSTEPEGTYIQGDNCTRQTNDWTFKKCKDKLKMFYHYKSDAGDRNCSNCGNCPFGDISTSSSDKIGNRGIAEGDTSIACYDDGQLHALPPIPKDPKWKKWVPPSGTGFICRKCLEGDPEYSTLCTLTSSCGEDNGDENCGFPYVLNYDKNDCVHPCQLGGGDARNKGNNNDSVEPDFDFVRLDASISTRDFCVRKLPYQGGICEKWSGSCNRLSGDVGGNFRSDPNCWSFDNEDDCFVPIYNNYEINNNNDPTLPVFVYPKDIDWNTPGGISPEGKTPGPPAIGAIAQCWSVTPNTKNISFPTYKIYEVDDKMNHPLPVFIRDNFCPGEFEKL